MSAATPLWLDALVEREREKQSAQSRGAASRMALVKLLWRAGYPISLVTVHGWSRAQQGVAYLWAFAFVNGREDVPAPRFVFEAYR